MKKYLTFILMFSLCFGFVACGSDDDEDGGDGGDDNNFTWNGDWNDKEHPQYNGYYNPLEGDWINEKGTGRWIFTKDFRFVITVWDEDKGKWTDDDPGDKYIINNIGLEYTTASGMKKSVMEYKIVVENGEKYLITRYQGRHYNGTYVPFTEWSGKYRPFIE